MPWPQERPASRYPSDLTDEEWEIIQPIFEPLDPYTRGRPREVDVREVLNAIFYLNKTGCPWRYLPKDFPHYTVVSYYYHKWVRSCRQIDESGNHQDSQEVMGNVLEMMCPLKHGHILCQIILVDTPEGP
jgi:hypothetical protein